MIILGINSYHPDAAAAILVDGQVVAAVEEERFNRIKHAAGWPAMAIKYCVDAAGVRPEEIDHIVIPRKRAANLGKKALWAMRNPTSAFQRARAWARFSEVEGAVADSLDVSPSSLKAELHYVGHHAAHAASSLFSSPFDDAAVLVLDGLGDFASMLWGSGKDRNLSAKGGVHFPHSIGFFYTAVTQYLGFWSYGDEYKVMGLGAYGEPRYADVFQDMIQVKPGMDFALNLKYFSHESEAAKMTWKSGAPKLGRMFSEHLEHVLGPARQPGAPVEKHHEDIATTLQWRLEEATLDLLNQLHKEVPSENLCYSGGVAFNCVANGKIFDETPFKRLYIHPAAGDSGLAVGAAQYVHHQVLGYPRGFQMDHAYWGPEYNEDRQKEALDRYGLSYVTLEEAHLVEETARHIAQGSIVGWFQGRAEWGPRALGNRSIVVDPRRADMRETLNNRIKHREPFRPFSPSILAERTGDWFERDDPSPFMLLAFPAKEGKRDLIPAPIHVDGTGRLQTVERSANPLYWELIRAFEKETDVPVVLNTSFNESEPIVNTPEEAIECFLRTKMDVLVMGPYLVTRATGQV